MTSESKADTEPWVEEKKAAYPYAYDKGGKLSTALGVTGIPAAFLVNPKGIVVWKGHPGGLRAGIIEEHIKGAKKSAPGIEGLTSSWPKSAASIKKLLIKNKIGQALTAAQRLAEKDQECKVVVETLAGLAQAEIDAVKELGDVGDILGALDTAKLAKKTLAGSDELKKLEALVKEIKASKDASKIVKAQTLLAKLKSKASDLRKTKEAVALIKKVNKLLKKNADNFAGQDAEKLKAKIRKKMERMRR